MIDVIESAAFINGIWPKKSFSEIQFFILFFHEDFIQNDFNVVMYKDVHVFVSFIKSYCRHLHNATNFVYKIAESAREIIRLDVRITSQIFVNICCSWSARFNSWI